MKRVLIFGSSGTIGANALEVIRKKPGAFAVYGLCVYKDIDTLRRQIKEFSPAYVCVVDEKRAGQLEKSLHRKVKLFKGKEGLKEFSALPSDISLMAIAGISCLEPLLINVAYTKRIALANKEAVVGAGAFVFRRAKKFNTEIIPVDSEINALFQLFKTAGSDFSKVYLTASGGSLINYKKKDLARVGVKQVLSHPTWRMGKRITVDSATLVNKAFEVVETHRFFNLPYNKIDIMIHKESAIHALVEFCDNTIFACFYPPDMKIPIGFALCYPSRYLAAAGTDLSKKFSLSFAPVDYRRFPLLEIILAAAKRGDNSLVILNACDEVAIDCFLKSKVKFRGIYKVMEHIFNRYPSHKLGKVEDIFYWDRWARAKTREYLGV